MGHNSWGRRHWRRLRDRSSSRGERRGRFGRQGGTELEVGGVDGGDGWGLAVGGARELEDKGVGDGAERGETRVEGGEVGGGRGDGDVGEAVGEFRGVFFAVSEVKFGGGGEAALVVEFGSFVGDRRVAWAEEGVAKSGAEGVTFSVDGVEIDG